MVRCTRSAMSHKIFSDKFVNISDHIVTADEDDDSDFDTSWVQDYLETRRNAIEHGDMPIQSVDQIDYIDLALNGGEFTIENGSDFAVSASVNFRRYADKRYTLDCFALGKR